MGVFFIGHAFKLSYVVYFYVGMQLTHMYVNIIPIYSPTKIM